MNQITSHSIVARGEGLIETEYNGEMVALHIANGTCYGFNGTAYRLWQMLEQPRNIAALCTMMVEEYDVDPATCEQEVCALVADLMTDRLVTIENP